MRRPKCTTSACAVDVRPSLVPSSMSARFIQRRTAYSATLKSIATSATLGSPRRATVTTSLLDSGASVHATAGKVQKVDESVSAEIAGDRMAGRGLLLQCFRWPLASGPEDLVERLRRSRQTSLVVSNCVATPSPEHRHNHDSHGFGEPASFAGRSVPWPLRFEVGRDRNHGAGKDFRQ